MTRIPFGAIAAACAALAAVSWTLVAPASVSGQAPAPPISGQTPVPSAPPTGPAPRLPSGKVDFSGVWQRPYVPDMSKNGRGQQGFAELPFTPEGLADWKSYDAANGDYTGSCMPFGLSRSMNSPEPVQIIQSDKYLALLFEQNTWFHVVHLDGRGHPADVNPTWFGHSTGKWDHDTLIIDTVHFNGWTRLDTIGHPHSDALHVVQTFQRTDFGHIAYTVTIDDPKMYTRPWKNERTFTLMDTELIEYSCEENNRDLREGRVKLWVPPPARK